MPKTTERTQRYRLTYEFILRDRNDYSLVRLAAENHLRTIAESIPHGMQGGYLTIKKIVDHAQT